MPAPLTELNRESGAPVVGGWMGLTAMPCRHNPGSKYLERFWFSSGSEERKALLSDQKKLWASLLLALVVEASNW